MKKWTQLSDDELIDVVKNQKDPEAFGELYERYKNMVYNRCISILNDIEDAKDLTQEVFIRAFVYLRGFKGQAKFSSWLYVMTYNYCINHIKRNTDYKIKLNKTDIDTLSNGIDAIDDTNFFSIPVDKLKIALNKIPLEDKSLLLLKYQDGLTVKELKTLYDISESAIKMRLLRAKSKLAKQYANTRHTTYK